MDGDGVVMGFLPFQRDFTFLVFSIQRQSYDVLLILFENDNFSNYIRHGSESASKGKMHLYNLIRIRIGDRQPEATGNNMPEESREKQYQRLAGRKPKQLSPIITTRVNAG